MKLNEHDEWAKIRSEGIFLFILKAGFLRWSLPMALLLSIITEVFINGIGINAHTFADTLGLFLLFFIPAGVLFGSYLWWNNNKKYPEDNIAEEAEL